jgi:hypothetical protein
MLQPAMLGKFVSIISSEARMEMGLEITSTGKVMLHQEFMPALG